MSFWLPHKRLIAPRSPEYPGMFAAVGTRLRYEPNAVVFDGANDWLSRSSQYSTVADGKLWTFSMAIKFNGLAKSQGIINGSSSSGSVFDQYRVRFTSGDRLAVTLDDAAGPTLINDFDDDPGWSVGVWYSLVVTVDLTNGGAMYRGDTQIGTTTTAAGDGDFTVDENMIGARTIGSGSEKFDGELADLRMWIGSVIDISVEANRRLFFDANGCLVEPASDGAIAGLGTPTLFLGGPSTSTNWHEDRSGNNNDLTVNGALADSANPPCGL